VDLKQQAEDVKPFLINPDEVNRVLSFREFVGKL
jgi:hypothetical protein